MQSGGRVFVIVRWRELSQFNCFLFSRSSCLFCNFHDTPRGPTYSPLDG
uniref:Bg55 protein n=1 Tax=Rhizophora mucronata TaxID=61149 RepID=A0A2P2ILM6_RHIMU